MATPTRTELVQATAGYMAAYIDEKVSLDAPVENLDPNLNIEGFDQLLGYYFLLTGKAQPAAWDRGEVALQTEDTGGIVDPQGEAVGVLDFVSLIPERLRTLAPGTRTRTETFQGEVRGRIDWQETTKHRYSSQQPSQQEFVCETRQRTVDTTQNQVLVTLLTTIKQLVSRVHEQLRGDTTSKNNWLQPWAENGYIYQTFREQLESPHLSGLEVGESDITDRDLQAVLQSPVPLYREAAVLLRALRRIRRQELTEQELEALLSLGLFGPTEKDQDADDLFELYWIFKLLEHYPDAEFKQFTQSQQLMAAWEAEGYEYLLFNDWEGHHHWEDERQYQDYIDISWDLAEIEDTDVPPGFMQQYQGVLAQQHRLTENVFGWEFGRKTPDIVLLRLDTTESTDSKAVLTDLFIGEVKRSDSSVTIKKGLRQLFEYGALAKFGTHLTNKSGENRMYIAKNATVVDSPNVELGYFIGDHELIEDTPPDGIQIKGWGAEPTKPFATPDS